MVKLGQDVLNPKDSMSVPVVINVPCYEIKYFRFDPSRRFNKAEPRTCHKLHFSKSLPIDFPVILHGVAFSVYTGIAHGLLATRCLSNLPRSSPST